MSKFLEIYWANTHNLKNIDLKIPKNKITVISGLSGSWKSSLAFNTIYSIWQQKYLESLSTYSRMFIWWMKDDAQVSEIRGLSPTISIDQKTTSRHPRSTVGTITEIYDYYKLLYLNIWIRKCIKCWNIVKKDTNKDIIDFLLSFEKSSKFMILFPLKKAFKDIQELKKEILSLWFIRFFIWDIQYNINDNIDLYDAISNVNIIVDRLFISDYNDINSSDTKRLKDSISLAYRFGNWQLSINIIDIKDENNIIKKSFSNVFICSNCAHIPKELNISSFSFNSHTWACDTCHWLWVKMVFLEEKIINYKLTLAEWAVIAPWFWWEYFYALLREISKHKNIDINKKYKYLSDYEKNFILYWDKTKKYNISYKNEFGVEHKYSSIFEGVINTLERRFFEWWSEKWHYDNFISEVICPICSWYRLNNDSLSVYIWEKNIWELSELSILESKEFFTNLRLNDTEKLISAKIVKNINERLDFLIWVWLEYISISRKSATLSWWEAQRIRLATQLWTMLEWIIYILDEPSIWLHPIDNDMLIKNLKKLRDLWNTLIIVEHDEDIIKNADYIVDIWPWAWVHWWEIVAKWTFDEIINNKNSITGPYISWNKRISIKRKTRFKNNFLRLFWASQNNLKNIDISIPLSNFVCVTWVSWSWKSSLVNDIIANYLANKLNKANRNLGKFKKIEWIEYLDKAVIIDQSPIWKTPRSNPATYTWLLTHIRDVFAMTEEANIRWYWAWNFSFNTKHWRCELCDGDWVKRIEMHFLAPVYVECEWCNWRRYNNEVLEVRYKWKNISEVLNMTVEEALDFFSNHSKIKRILTTLSQVGLDYIKLWQSSITLSWWESQRIKLSSELSKLSTTKTFYILDEPTTWLHFADVEKLLVILHSLVDKWNSVLVIEHNMDVILNSDFIIDIWLKWWNQWGYLIASWDINDIKNTTNSLTWASILKYEKAFNYNKKILWI